MLTKVPFTQTMLLPLCLVAVATLVHAQVGNTSAAKGDDVQVILTTSKPQYSAEEPVIVDLHIVNKSDKPIFFDDYKSPLENQNLVVTDDAGHSIPLTAYGKILTAKRSHGLPPVGNGPSSGADLKMGQEAVYHVWLNRVFDLSVAGVYIISATKHLPNAAGNSQPVSSIPLKISITSPDIPPYSERLGPDESPRSDNSWGNMPGVIHI